MGTSNKAKEDDDGIDVYFRDVDLSALSGQEVAKYSAFPGAPPQIPHAVEDMYPITLDDNECLECHHPENAVEGDDIPLPESHFDRPVMAKGKTDEAMAWVVKGYEKAKDLPGTRYGCNICHTPQATNVRTPKTTFIAEKLPKK
jgi:cytochrome c-type protein NapB